MDAYDAYDLAEWEYEHDRLYGDRPATEAEAHIEWHRNTGVPIGTPGCPQDACHGDLPWNADPDAYDASLVAPSDEVYVGLGEIDGSDIPF